jgi:hypothetical protein
VELALTLVSKLLEELQEIIGFVESRSVNIIHTVLNVVPTLAVRMFYQQFGHLVIVNCRFLQLPYVQTNVLSVVNPGTCRD